MAESAEENTNTGQAETITVVSVPEYLVPQIMDFMKGLESAESDVSGHAFSRGGLGMRVGSLAAAGPTGTGCATTQTGSLGQDWTCSDNDS